MEGGDSEVVYRRKEGGCTSGEVVRREVAVE